VSEAQSAVTHCVLFSLHVQTLKPLLSYLRVLLRVRMLYYLKQEVIGEHSDAVLKGADIRY